MIRALLRRHPEERITSEDLLHHPWLTKENFRESVRSCSDQLVPLCVPPLAKRRRDDDAATATTGEDEQQRQDEEEEQQQAEENEGNYRESAAPADSFELDADMVPVLMRTGARSDSIMATTVAAAAAPDSLSATTSFISSWLRR